MGKTETITTSDTDSVTIKKNSKGTHDWEIKCYNSEAELAKTTAVQIDRLLAEEYKKENVEVKK